MNAKQIFVIDGSIGVGKSKFIEIVTNYIKKRDNKGKIIKAKYEPNDIWKKLGILDKYYKNMARWACTFQTIAFTTRLNDIIDDEEFDILFIERCVYTDKAIFAKNCYESGLMEETVYDAYCHNYDTMIKEFEDDLKIKKFIYLNAPAEICLERIKTRGRIEEKDISLDYLENLQEKYDEWMDEMAESFEIEKLDMSQDWMGKTESEYVEWVENYVESLIQRV